MTATYRNPVIPGFHPDPSVCRVGDDYYLAVSSFEWFPGIPLFHSRDLVHWRPIGHACTRTSQLNLKGRAASRGIFAPTIRHALGRFWVICTDTGGIGNFLLHAEDPTGPWSEPVPIAIDGIDPSITFCDDGSAYVTWCAHGEAINQVRIDPWTGTILDGLRPTWGGTGNKCPEAPHLYRIDGTWYLLLAEGGTEYGHMVTIARSADPWGPWESCPANPILSHRRFWRSPIQATGHGDLVQAQDGSWWMVFLGIRPIGGMFHHLGRETFLAPVRWQDGWPRVDVPLKEVLPAPTFAHHPWPGEPDRDDFDQPGLGPRWSFLRERRDDRLSTSERPGFLRLRGDGATLDDATASPVLAARRLSQHRQTTSIRLEFAPAAEGEEAGLGLFMNSGHHDEILVTRAGGQRAVRVRRRVGSLQQVVAEVAADGDGAVELAIRCDGPATAFLLNGAEIATGEVRYLASEVAKGFTGVMVVIYASGSGTDCTVPADVDWFRQTCP